MTGNLRDFSPRPGRAGRDPSGKRAIFSTSPEEPTTATTSDPAAEPPGGQPGQPDQPPQRARAVHQDPPRPGTLVVECSSCEQKARVSYFDFALLNLPLGFFVPIPGRRFKHRMTCPVCSRWTWVEARWLE